MTDRNDAETMYPNQKGGTGKWHIELRRYHIAHRGHAFLALVDEDGRTVRELHGAGFSKHTGKGTMVDGADLNVVDYKRQQDDKSDSGPYFQKGTISGVAPVASGSQHEMARIWARGVQAGAGIDDKKFDYKSHDPSYELGTDGGQIQNSNSVVFTLGKAMGLDLDRALRDKGMTRTFSGWGRDLLDPKYERYVAPPTFPVRDAP
jgi:hypothetical protein